MPSRLRTVGVLISWRRRHQGGDDVLTGERPGVRCCGRAVLTREGLALMVTVGDDISTVEVDLIEGRLSCPGCGDRLRPWGFARVRQVRAGLDDEGPGRTRHRPRRARCAGCGATHVLLAVSLALRRADAAAVIAAAVEAKVAGGLGHRKIAAWLGRPASTVRGWLRAFAASAQAMVEAFAVLVARHAADAAAVWPAAAQDVGGRALAVLAAYAAAVARRFDVGTLAWVRAAITATSGRLFSASWWAGAAQHELTLTPAPGAAPGSR